MGRRPKGDTVVAEILERFDPDTDIEADSDPTFEAKFDTENHADKHIVWVHKDDVGKYKFWRYQQLKAGPDSPRLMCGDSFVDGEDMTFREHVAMYRDAKYHEKVELAQRRENRDLRSRMIKNANKTKYVNSPGQPGS
jgi:hypothetical protein